MKEIKIHNKVLYITEGQPSTIERMERYRQGARLANLVARQVDECFARCRDEVVINVYNKVLEELGDK